MAVISSGKPTKKKPTLGKAVRPSKQIERKFSGIMLELSARLEKEINARSANFNTPREAFAALRDTLKFYDDNLNRISNQIAIDLTNEVDGNEKARLQDMLARAMGVETVYIFDNPEIADALLIAQTEAANLITGFAHDYIDDISKVVLDNFKQLPLPEGKSLTDCIQDIHEMSRYRARLIARDQTSKMTTALNMTRQTAVGIDEYIWRTAGQDNRVVGNPGGLYPKGNAIHMNHYERNGKRFRWDSPPPDGHPGYAINCFPGESEVNLSYGCNKLWRRRFTGQVVTIETSNGASLKSTLNHPILTGRGWLAANEIQEGDYLVKTFNECGIVMNSNNSKSVTSFESVFNAFSEAIGTQAATGTKFDFHTDGTENQIDTIDIEGFLTRYQITSFNEFVIKLIFSWAKHCTPGTSVNFASLGSFNALCNTSCHSSNSVMSIFRNALSFFSGSFGHSNKHAFTSVSFSDAILSYNSCYNVSRNFVLSSNFFSASAVNVFLNNSTLIQMIDSVMSGGQNALNDNTPSAEFLAEIIGIAPQFDGNLAESNTFTYELCRVIKKSFGEFSNHVYNLQSNLGYYTINNGIVVHNCRCVAIPVIDPAKIILS